MHDPQTPWWKTLRLPECVELSRWGEWTRRTLLDLNRLGKVVNVDDKDPFVPEVLCLAGEDDLLSPSAERLVAGAGEKLSRSYQVRSVFFTGWGASAIEYLLEQSRAHGRVFCQQWPGDQVWVVRWVTAEVFRTAGALGPIPGLFSVPASSSWPFLLPPASPSRFVLGPANVTVAVIERFLIIKNFNLHKFIV